MQEVTGSIEDRAAEDDESEIAWESVRVNLDLFPIFKLRADFPFNLTRVGVTGVKLIKVERSYERPVVLISKLCSSTFHPTARVPTSLGTRAIDRFSRMP